MQWRMAVFSRWEIWCGKVWEDGAGSQGCWFEVETGTSSDDGLTWKAFFQLISGDYCMHHLSQSIDSQSAHPLVDRSSHTYGYYYQSLEKSHRFTCDPMEMCIQGIWKLLKNELTYLLKEYLTRDQMEMYFPRIPPMYVWWCSLFSRLYIFL